MSPKPRHVQTRRRRMKCDGPRPLNVWRHRCALWSTLEWRSQMKRALFASLVVASLLHVMVGAQQGGLNTPVLPGLPRDPAAPNAKLTSDLLQQRQVEPDIVVSTRNPLHLMAFFNDYRAVDLAADSALPGRQSNGGLKGVPGQLLA